MAEITLATSNTEPDASPYRLSAIAVIATWLLAIVALALTGSFSYGPGQQAINILLAITLPVVIFSASYLSIASFRQWVLSLDMRHLSLFPQAMIPGLFVPLYIIIHLIICA